MTKLSSTEPARQRTHAERMLKRAERRQKQAAKLVAKWNERIAELDRAGIAVAQPTLWAEIPEAGSVEQAATPDILAP